MTDAILAILARILRDKGANPPPLDETTVFLGGAIPFDSLDLATLLVEMERATGRDPFKEGFRMFQTVGELAQLYAA
ncbi:MAG: acyl carrier protein [Magnetococcales bacterium]|nr:acyl carrier protein [Magnetococcales bacterium]